MTQATTDDEDIKAQRAEETPATANDASEGAAENTAQLPLPDGDVKAPKELASSSAEAPSSIAEAPTEPRPQREQRDPARRPAGGRRRVGSRRANGPARGPSYNSDESGPPSGEPRRSSERSAFIASLPPLTEETRVTSIPELEALSLETLMQAGEQLEIPNAAYLRKDDLVHRLVQIHGERGGEVMTSGVLDITNDGYGFIRHRNLRHNMNDVYVSQSQIRRFGLRTGDFVTGQIRSPKSGEKYYGLLRVETINDQDPETARMRPPFDQLTALFPDELFDLETGQKALSARMLNLIAPMGKGQRGLIVSPPKAGKTILLHQIADALAENYPEVHILAALIGERPEEVTDWERTVKGAEVVASTFDEPVEEHTRTAEIVLARAKRLVEAGQDVVILLDSLTRLARAYNLATPSSGRTLSGGMDPIALYPPKHFFGAARNTEEAGTLTIIATCLVDTGSRMDELIYEEFKGTGNMEVHLDRRLAEKRIYPSIDVLRSGTRRDERLYDEQTYKGIVTLRRMLAMLSNSAMDSSDATERILDRLSKTKDNVDFVANLSKEI